MKTIKKRGNRFTKRTVSPIILVAFFVYTIIPANLHAAECVDWDGDGWGWDGEKGCKMSDEVELKAPTTMNNKAEEAKDGNNLTNDLPPVIPAGKTKALICKATKDTATNGGWGWDGEKGCKVEIVSRAGNVDFEKKSLRPVVPEENVSRAGNVDFEENNLKTLSRENIVLSLLNYSSNFMASVFSGAFATQPFNQTTLALLFNNSNYITLRKKAEEDKKKKLNNLNKDRNNKLKSLKNNYQNLVNKLRNSFQKKKEALRVRKQNILNRLQQTTGTINSIQNGLNRINSLKQKLLSLHNDFNYAQSQENYHYQKYLQEKKEEKHNKKKYKKYKKKYKKKHKSKYKKRYKKYKKRYKKHKKRAQNEKNSWQYFARLKKARALEYAQVRKEIASLENRRKDLDSLQRAKSSLQWEANTFASLETQALSQAQKELNSSLASALSDYETNQKTIADEYINSLGLAEEDYQENLKKTEVYQEKIDVIFDQAGLIFLTKAEKEEVLNQLNEKLNQEKETVRARINSRYNYLKDLAQAVRDNIANNAQGALNIVNQKVVLAASALAMVKDKTRKDRHKYEDRKDIEKKAKSASKKYKKYLKKAQKYKKKGNSKKYHKYLGKANSKLKKYKKYAKKLAKYGGTTKHYKEGFKALENLVKQYENQYRNTLQEQQRARQTYGVILRQADSKKQAILNDAQREKERESNKLIQAGVDYYQFNNIGIYQELKLQPYFQGISTIQINGGIMGAEAGLATAKSITKQISKLSHKIKKRYKKAVKKAKKKEAERIAKLKAQQEQQRRAYYQQQARRRARIVKDNRTAGVWFDANGNGYSGFYSKRGGYFKAPPTQSPWKKFISYSAPIVSQSKKNWWDKAKSLGGGINNWLGKHPIIKSLLKTVNNVMTLTSPVIGMKVIGWGGKLWYDSYKDKDAFDKVHQVVNTVSATSATASLGMAATGVGVLPAAVSTVIGSISDLISAGMYAFKGEWGMAGLMAFGAIPVIGDIVQVARLAKGGAKGIKLATAVAKASTEEREFAEWFAKAAYEKNWKTMVNYKGFERLTDVKFIQKTFGIKNKLLKDSRSVIFYNKETGKAIISSAGTRLTSVSDWVADIANVFGLKTKQYEAAQKISEIISGRQVAKKFLAVIGHSLGGGKAKVIGLANDIKTYTFNTAFVHSRWLNNVAGESIDFVKTGETLNYLQTGSLLKKIFPKQFGQTVKYGDEIYDTLPGSTLRARLFKIIFGVRRHGIN